MLKVGETVVLRLSSSDRNSSAPGAVQPVARNLRRWRKARGLTLSALAEQAGVAKSTVSLIERGEGNPSIDTIWALAAALGVPFASLFHDDAPTADLLVVREADAAVVAVDQAGLDTDGFVARHMLTRTGRALIEVYWLVLDEGATRDSKGHLSGMFEHITVASGKLEVSTASFTEVLDQGDLISFRADRPRTYRALDGPARFVSIQEYTHHSEV
jgi:XRE family transcriptional regulator, regulator of sulfur utilization